MHRPAGGNSRPVQSTSTLLDTNTTMTTKSVETGFVKLTSECSMDDKDFVFGGIAVWTAPQRTMLQGWR